MRNLSGTEVPSDPAARAAWERLDAALDELLALPREQREAAVLRLAAGDASMASELRALLAGVDVGDSLLDHPASEMLAVAAPRVTGLAAGTRLGAWCIEELIGRGGMGQVYRGRRADGQFDQAVAIKVARIDSDGARLRFPLERQIVARLDHPGIARLIDGGIADGGQPYMVMELVHGLPIIQWCEGRHATLEQRLDLFEAVCEAASYAHRHLVIHRDIKPSNVLVTDDGHAKLLDFGIARMLDATSTGCTDVVLLTPAYASPEQLGGEPLSTATDVYALGLLLHELLTGIGAQKVGHLPMAAAIHTVMNSEPRAPSAVAREATHSPVPASLLEGDLDAIVAKALRKEPGQRYPTVDALLEDLGRHRRHLPVQARSGRWSYRAGRALRRHRVAAVAGAVVALSVVVGTGAVAWQARVARQEAARAVAVKNFLLQMLTGEDPGLANGRPPSEVTVLQLLDEASERVAHGLDDQPSVKLELLETMGSAYTILDRPAQSQELLKQALAVSERIDGVPHARQAHLLVLLAGVAQFAGRFDEMDPWLDRADKVFRALGDHTSSDYARSLTLRSGLLRRPGSIQLPAARDLLRQAATLYREGHVAADDGPVGALMALAQVERGLDDMPAALQAAEEAVTVESQSGKSPVGFANVRSLRAVMRFTMGDAQGAVDDYTVAAQGYTAALGANHFQTLANESLRGQALLRLGRQAEGLQALQHSAETLSHTRAGSNTHTQAVVRLGVALVSLGLVERAEPVLQTGIDLCRQRKDFLQASTAQLALANALHQRGDEARARALLDEAYAVRIRQDHNTAAPLSEVLLSYAQFALDAGRLEEAQSRAQAALQSAAGPGISDQIQRVRARVIMTRVLLSRADAAGAKAFSAELLGEVQSPALHGFTTLRSTVLEVHGNVLCALGPADQGRGWLQQALTLREPLVDAVDLGTATLRLALANCERQQGAAEGDRQVALAHAAFAAHSQVARYLSQSPATLRP